MSLKPGLEFDSHLKELVGLTFPVTPEYTKENPEPEPELLKKEFITKANAEVITTLDGKLSLPVGVAYVEKSNNGEEVAGHIQSCIRQLQICVRCLQILTETERNIITFDGTLCASHCNGKHLTPN